MMIEVNKGEVLSLEKSPAGWEIRAREGVLWLTSEGDVNDFLLKASDSVLRFNKGKILIEALSEKARFELLKRS